MSCPWRCDDEGVGEDSVLVALRAGLPAEGALMRRGIFTDPGKGREYAEAS
ncbi:MAG: hypothetical protein MUQ10_01625 [Anaerolineae bacterium]|nr:hypothetical protein [Anaerolineae bacterium]